ncbi:MFS transporter [Streptomyces iconiensis]|uniref:MFS transporter n=1 Tax=Streptomyces iconiensis TaxID=1384038 RepID=A0ABT7A898_9ACTN|nr:MFS transporter [Streptomyces iconiensis]MDJ1137541.1 MFS transporter [Streptomyces iconiensis]
MARSDQWRSLALLACAQFVLILDTAIINVAAPSIGRDLDIAPAQLSWVANAYLVSFGGLLLLSGRAADFVGRRTLFTAGLGVLAIASLAGSLATTAPLLIAARAGQGLGAAMAAAAAFALLLALFPEGPDRHKALGVFAAMAGAGGAAGTVLGGMLTSWLGWQSTFAMNVTVAVVLIACAFRLLPAAPPAKAARGFDLAGAATVTGGLALLAYALVNTAQTSWTAPGTLLTGGAAVVLLAAFVVIERFAAVPLVPPSVFRRRTLRRANILAGLSQVSLFPMFFLVSLYLQAVLGYEPVAGGSALLPLCLVVMGVASHAGRLIGRLGLRTVMCGGFLMVAGGMGWLSLLSASGPYVSEVLPATLVIGVGLPLVAVTTNVAATADAGPEEIGLASGLVNTSLQFGSVIGLAVLSAVAAARSDAVGSTGAEALTEGFAAAFLTGAAVALAGALLSLALRRPTAPGVSTPLGAPGEPGARTPA